MLTPKAGALVDYFTPEERNVLFDAVFHYRAIYENHLVTDYDCFPEEQLKREQLELETLSYLLPFFEMAKNYGK